MNVVIKEDKKGNGGRGGGRGGRGGRGSQSTAAPQVVLVACQCLGTRHPHVTNCTSCGYILCQFEVEKQPGEVLCCPFCRAACSALMSAADLQRQGHVDDSTLAAYTQKDTLIQYDKEHTKRTVVHDAQADYYVSGTWLSEEERKALDLKEKKRLEAKKRSNHQHRVNIRFDIAGKKIVEYKGEEDEEAVGEEEQEGFVVCKAGLDEVDRDYAFVNGNDGVYINPHDQPSHVYENSELEYGSSKAAEIYRHMKKSWEEDQQKEREEAVIVSHANRGRVQYD